MRALGLSAREARPEVERVPEPELMVDREQARAYAAGDFEEPHSHCVALLLDRLSELPPQGFAVDLGCGPADITLRLARALPGWRMLGVDGSQAMLECGRDALARSGLAARVSLHEALLPAAALPGAPFDLVVSNSLLHHLADPSVLWSTARSVSRTGALIFVMDLMRPESSARVDELVECYAENEPRALRHDFEASLYAAYSVAEVREQLAVLGMSAVKVESVSDRHWIAWGRIPSEEPADELCE